jgi:predicted DNA binding CopG/RHH family protein
MKKKLPQFKTSEEAARFWDTHSLTNYLHEFNEVDEMFVLSPALAREIRERAKRRLVSLRLARWEIDRSKKIAQRKNVPYQALIREWIDDGIRRESLAEAA